MALVGPITVRPTASDLAFVSLNSQAPKERVARLIADGSVAG